MKNIGIIAEETASLPQEIIDKHQMAFVPYLVDWPEGDNLPGENIFQKMREADKQGIQSLPKTSQPSPWTFKKIFEQELLKSEDLLCITLSSKLSGGYNSALQARKMLSDSDQPRVHIIDCFNVSAGEGLFNLRAVDLIEQGKDIEEIVKEIKRFIHNVHLFGMVQDPKWLEAGGRMSHHLAVLVRQMAKIGMRPLLGVKEGVVTSVALKMQAKDLPTALFREFEKETKELREKGKKIRVAITHADNFQSAQELKELIKKNASDVEIAFISLIDPIIGVHVGPGTLICTWCEK